MIFSGNPGNWREPLSGGDIPGFCIKAVFPMKLHTDTAGKNSLMQLPRHLSSGLILFMNRGFMIRISWKKHRNLRIGNTLQKNGIWNGSFRRHPGHEV